MKIFLGPAGIPIVCRGNTLEGIKTVAKLGLQAMEIEFVEGIYMNNETAKECGKVAEELNIQLSVHCPYFINLCSQEGKIIGISKKNILDSAERANAMNANIVVFHPGFYGKLSSEKAFEKVRENCEGLIKGFKERKIENVKLGLETTGKVSQFGELEEIIKICKEVEGCVPVIDWAHIFARQAGRIDYKKIFDKVEKLKLKNLHTHFTGVEFSPIKMTGKGNEKYHLEMNSNKPPFEPLAKEILKRKIGIIIISESPVLEQDSLKMKEIFEKLRYKF